MMKMDDETVQEKERFARYVKIPGEMCEKCRKSEIWLSLWEGENKELILGVLADENKPFSQYIQSKMIFQLK